MNIDLNEYTGLVISKTLEFTGVEKNEEEITAFCSDLMKDEEIIEALKNMVSVE